MDRRVAWHDAGRFGNARPWSDLLDDPQRRAQMGVAARRFALDERNRDRAADILARGLAVAIANHAARRAQPAMEPMP